MIWSTTTHVGMAFAISPSGATYVVARYSPPGNILGESPQQATTSNREGITPANAFTPYARVPMSTPFSDVHRKYSPYGHNPHLGLQHDNGRRAYEDLFGSTEGPLPSPRYSIPRLTAPDALGRRHVYQVDTGPSPFFSRPPPSSRRMPYGSPYSRGPGPYGVGAPGSYASTIPPAVGYGGHRSRGNSGALCCSVM
jgi:hypothetical protein